VTASDIDVLLVSDELTQDEAYARFQKAEKRLGRRTARRSTRRKSSPGVDVKAIPFLTRVLSGKYVVLDAPAA
jgi:hypothetical protein